MSTPQNTSNKVEGPLHAIAAATVTTLAGAGTGAAAVYAGAGSYVLNSSKDAGTVFAVSSAFFVLYGASKVFNLNSKPKLIKAVANISAAAGILYAGYTLSKKSVTVQPCLIVQTQNTGLFCRL